ncbi:MAG: hypothetical protein R2882_11805 [Gemmatimonadales bacterium]
MTNRRPFLVAIAGLSLAAIPLAAQQRQGPTPEQRAEQERRYREELAAPRPVDALNSIWIEDLT